MLQRFLEISKKSRRYLLITYNPNIQVFFTEWGFMSTMIYFIIISFKSPSPKPTLSMSTYFSAIFVIEIFITIFFWVIMFPQIFELDLSYNIFFMIFPHFAPCFTLIPEFIFNQIVIQLRSLV